MYAFMGMPWGRSLNVGLQGCHVSDIVMIHDMKGWPAGKLSKESFFRGALVTLTQTHETRVSKNPQKDLQRTCQFSIGASKRFCTYTKLGRGCDHGLRNPALRPACYSKVVQENVLQPVQIQRTASAATQRPAFTTSEIDSSRQQG